MLFVSVVSAAIETSVWDGFMVTRLALASVGVMVLETTTDQCARIKLMQEQKN